MQLFKTRYIKCLSRVGLKLEKVDWELDGHKVHRHTSPQYNATLDIA